MSLRRPFHGFPFFDKDPLVDVADGHKEGLYNRRQPLQRFLVHVLRVLTMFLKWWPAFGMYRGPKGRRTTRQKQKGFPGQVANQTNSCIRWAASAGDHFIENPYEIWVCLQIAEPTKLRLLSQPEKGAAPQNDTRHVRYRETLYKWWFKAKPSPTASVGGVSCPPNSF